eukprot:25896-Chlamydomonas_euryale.AAC.1
MCACTCARLPALPGVWCLLAWLAPHMCGGTCVGARVVGACVGAHAGGRMCVGGLRRMLKEDKAHRVRARVPHGLCLACVGQGCKLREDAQPVECVRVSRLTDGMHVWGRDRSSRMASKKAQSQPSACMCIASPSLRVCGVAATVMRAGCDARGL